MDFITCLWRTSRRRYSIIVMVDILTKVAHFIPVKSMYSSGEVAQVFIEERVRFHGVIKKIISDRDAKFTSKF